MKQWVEQRGTWENFWWKQNFKLIDQIYFVFYPTHSGTQKPGQGLISALLKVCNIFICLNQVSIMKTLPPVWWDVLRDSHLVYRWEPRDTSRGCVTMSRHAWLGPASDNAEANWCNPLVIIVITQYCCPHNPSPDGSLTPKWSNTRLLQSDGGIIMESVFLLWEVLSINPPNCHPRNKSHLRGSLCEDISITFTW